MAVALLTAHAADSLQRPYEVIKPKRLIREQPEDRAAKFGESAEFRIAIDHPKAKYQWMKDFRAIPGATKPILQVGKVSKETLGTYVCVVATEDDDQPQFAMSDPVSLLAYSVKEGKRIVVEMWVDPVFCESMQRLPWNPPVKQAKNDLINATGSENLLIYAANRGRVPFLDESDETALYFVSTSTNTITVLPYSIGPAGSAGTTNCPPQYRCVLNFRRLPPWTPISGVASGQAKHLQSTATVVKFWRDTAVSGCGTNGVVTISPLQSGGYRFAVFCPSSAFPTCPSGTHELELTGFQ
jgi:hypothetical protein